VIVGLQAVQRWAIVHHARLLLGTPHSLKSDDVWMDLVELPERLSSASFIVRVAADALGYRTRHLPADARWLIDNLAIVTIPEPGDLVGYSRPAIRNQSDRREWHVMLYAGNASVIGPCDIAGNVVERALDYELKHGARRWSFAGDRPFRRLELA
jgi:hypothetical protein